MSKALYAQAASLTIEGPIVRVPVLSLTIEGVVTRIVLTRDQLASIVLEGVREFAKEQGK